IARRGARIVDRVADHHGLAVARVVDRRAERRQLVRAGQARQRAVHVAPDHRAVAAKVDLDEPAARHPEVLGDVDRYSVEQRGLLGRRAQHLADPDLELEVARVLLQRCHQVQARGLGIAARAGAADREQGDDARARGDEHRQPVEAPADEQQATERDRARTRREGEAAQPAGRCHRRFSTAKLSSKHAPSRSATSSVPRSWRTSVLTSRRPSDLPPRTSSPGGSPTPLSLTARRIRSWSRDSSTRSSPLRPSLNACLSAFVISSLSSRPHGIALSTGTATFSIARSSLMLSGAIPIARNTLFTSSLIYSENGTLE